MRRRLLLTASCALALACVNVLDDIETAGRQPSVFGRILAVEDGRTLTGFDFFGNEEFRLLILPDGSQTAFTYKPDENGFFCWELPPGDYTLAAWTRGFRKTLTSGRIDVRFSVPKATEPLYIGTLALLFERGSYQIRIDDERTGVGCGGQIANATTRLMTRVPEPGSFGETLPICDAFWGMECDAYHAGVVPISPRAAKNFPRPGGVAPRLTWESVGNGRFTYDAVVYEAAHWTETGVDPQYFPGRIALYQENLTEPSLRLALSTTLPRDSRFYWTVRLRDGERVSTWSTFGFIDVNPFFFGISPLGVTGVSFGDNRLFTFSTP